MSGVGPLEVGRRLNSDEAVEIHAIEQVSRVGGDFEPEELLVAALTPETERFGQPHIQAREIGPALRVSPHAHWTIIYHRILIVVEAGGDVVRAGGAVIDDRRHLEAERQREQRGDEKLMPRVAERKPALGPEVVTVHRK